MKAVGIKTKLVEVFTAKVRSRFGVTELSSKRRLVSKVRRDYKRTRVNCLKLSCSRRPFWSWSTWNNRTMSFAASSTTIIGV